MSKSILKKICAAAAGNGLALIATWLAPIHARADLPLGPGFEPVVIKDHEDLIGVVTVEITLVSPAGKVKRKIAA